MRLNHEFYFSDPEPPIITNMCGRSGICGQFGLCFFMGFFCNIIKVNHFLHCFIILLYSISSFSLTTSLLIPCAYVSVNSKDCILLPSFELKSISSISLVKTLCFSLLNPCCVLMSIYCFL